LRGRFIPLRSADPGLVRSEEIVTCDFNGDSEMSQGVRMTGVNVAYSDNTL